MRRQPAPVPAGPATASFAPENFLGFSKARKTCQRLTCREADKASHSKVKTRRGCTRISSSKRQRCIAGRTESGLGDAKDISEKVRVRKGTHLRRPVLGAANVRAVSSPLYQQIENDSCDICTVDRMDTNCIL